MTTQLTVEQQLELQVKDLKSRILDTQDALQQKVASEKELAAALTEIVSIVGLQSETGQVQLVDVVDAVVELKKRLDEVESVEIEQSKEVE